MTEEPRLVYKNDYADRSSEGEKVVQKGMESGTSSSRKTTATTTSSSSSSSSSSPSNDSSSSSNEIVHTRSSNTASCADEKRAEEKKDDKELSDSVHDFFKNPENTERPRNPDPPGGRSISPVPRLQLQNGSGVAAVVVPKVIRVSAVHRTTNKVISGVLQGQGLTTLIRPRPVKTKALTDAVILDSFHTDTTMVQDDGRLLDDRRRKDDQKTEARKRKEAQVDFPSLAASHRMPGFNSNRMTLDHASGHQQQQHQTHHQPQQQPQHQLIPQGPLPQGYGATNGNRPHDPQSQRPHQILRTSRPTSGTSPATSNTSSKSKKPHSLGGSLSGGTGTNSERSTPSVYPAPLFQRLVSEEVQELKAYARIIESQNKRLAELERVHADLEGRLEMQSNRRMELERILEEREGEWAQQTADLEKDRDSWKKLVQTEKAKNAWLLEQIARKDQEIHRMLQRKYDNQRDSNVPLSVRNLRSDKPHPSDHRGSASVVSNKSSQTNGDPKPEQQNRSPHEIMASSGTVHDVRGRNVSNALKDFFGI